MFTIQRCSPKRGDICSCTQDVVPAIQCTHIKTVPSLLVRDSSGGRAIFHDSFFFLFIIYFMIFCIFLYRYIYILVLNYVYSKQPIFGLTQELLREVWSLSHRLIVYHSSSIHSPRLDVHTMTVICKLIGIWLFH